MSSSGADTPGEPGRTVVLGAVAGLAAGGWVGAADALRAALLAPRPFAPADAAAIVAAWAAAGLILGGILGSAAAFRRWPPARARLLPAHLLVLAFLSIGTALHVLPRSRSTPSLVVNSLLAAFVIAGWALLLREAYRRVLPRAAARPGRPDRPLLLAGAIPLAVVTAAPAVPWDPGADSSPPATLRTASGPAPNLLVVMVDSLRADRLGAFGSDRGLTPRLDAFARDAASFPETRTSSAWTKPSIASLLTGLRPERHGMLDAPDVLPPEVPTLHSLLGAAGWRTAVFSDSHWAVPEFGFQRGVNGRMVVPNSGGIRGSLPWAAWSRGRDFLLDSYSVGTPTEIRGAPELVREFLAWTDEEDPRPWFAYLHWMEPHHPYAPSRPSDPGRRRVPVPIHHGVHPFDRSPPIPAEDLRDLVANYDDEVRAVDRAFGGLIDALRTRGLEERTVIVFLSDHGEEFHEHGGWTHEHSLADVVVRIPLIVRVPRSPGRGVRIGGQVRIEDVLPTLLDLAGVAAFGPFDGRTLAPLIAGASEPPRPSTGLCRRSGSRAMVRSSVLDGWKMLAGSDGPFRLELFFDLARDPGEQSPVPAPTPDRAGALRRLMEEAESVEAAGTAPGRSRLPAQRRWGLEGLGYLGSPEPR